MPFLTSNLLLAAAEREPGDKSFLGPGMFYGLHVRTAKLRSNVPAAVKLNVKKAGFKDTVT